MKKGHLVMAATVLMALCGCGEKKQATVEQTVRVKVQEIHAEAVNGEQGFSGTIEEASGASLSFAAAGTIKRIYVDEGQMVRQGQLLAELDPTTLQNDQLKSAVAQEAMARKTLSDTKLHAPFSGYISSKNAEMGQNASPGMPVLKLVSIGSVKVKISVPEDDIQRIQKGSSMKIMVPALGNREFEGRVTERGVSADPRSRTYEVKASIQNHDGQLLPGMICQAFTNYMQGSTGVFIPANLVQLDSNNKTFVWVVNGEKALKREIIISKETAQGAQVSYGLVAGDKLIVAGQQKVSNGMKVEIVE